MIDTEGAGRRGRYLGDNREMGGNIPGQNQKCGTLGQTNIKDLSKA